MRERRGGWLHMRDLFGSGGVSYLTESMHGGGSPAAMKINIARHANYKPKQELAKRLAKIDD